MEADAQLGLFIHTEDRRVALKDSYTLAEVQRFFGVAENTVRKWTAPGGGLATVKFDRAVRVMRADLLLFIQKKKRAAAGDSDDAAAAVPDDKVIVERLAAAISAEIAEHLRYPYDSSRLARRVARRVVDLTREAGV